MPQLIEKKNCTGCTACVNICPKQCIRLQKDENGFSFPELSDEKACVECGACERVCPVLSEKSYVHNEFPVACAAYSKEDSLRMNSSSGGIFSEVAKWVIDQKGVVYGAAYNDEFGVYHCCVETVEDLSKLRGAKYAESYLGKSFFEILDRLKQNQYVLFSGTPCQVAGLKAFLKQDYEKLLCVDFVCHGVPSPMAWKEYVKYRAEKDNDGEFPISINLRSKITGWSKYQYSNLFQYDNGKEYSSLSSQNLFMKLFVGDYISRPSCANCSFKGYSRASDITLGDFWGIWDIEPEMDDNKGTSLVLIQSEKGKCVWQQINEKIVCKQVTMEQASQQNPSMLASSKAKENRDEVLEKIRNGRIEECEMLFVLSKPSFASRVKNKIKRIYHSI